jgi:hypothetical protein
LTLEKNLEHGVGNSPPPSVQSWSDTLRIPSFWLCEESDARSTSWDERRTPDSCASMFLGSWNGVLPQGNILTSRMVGKSVYRETGIMWKNKQMSMDYDDLFVFCIKINYNL